MLKRWDVEDDADDEAWTNVLSQIRVQQQHWVLKSFLSELSIHSSPQEMNDKTQYLLTVAAGFLAPSQTHILYNEKGLQIFRD